MSNLFDFNYKIINPESQGNLTHQVKDCVRQFGSLYSDLKSESVVVRVNWFYHDTEESTCTQMHGVVMNSMNLEDLGHIPLSIISERPIGAYMVQLVVCMITNFSDQVLSENKSVGDSVYCRVKYRNQKWLFTGGLGCIDEKLSSQNSAHQAFRGIKGILENENFSFPNIIRQWNYIPGITDSEKGEKSILVQKYQEFNNVRAAWYLKEDLKKDFPAATGIGVSGGGVNIEVIAIDPGKEVQIDSLHNPEQSDAHKYSASKLVGNDAIETPRFERGKMVSDKGHAHVWVSGTAAIIGESSVAGDIEKQTLITLSNIDQLIGSENLVKAGLEQEPESTEAVYIRAYVKYSTDGEMVYSLIQEKYPDAVCHVLEADVCRPELLVEIEGEFKVLS